MPSFRVGSRGGRGLPHRGRLAGRTRKATPVGRLFGVRELAFLAARDPSELTPQTCSWSLRSRPSSWGQRVRPGQGSAACGVQRQGPGQAREFREREAAAAVTRGPPVGRGGQTARVPQGLHHRPRRPRPRRLPVASSVLSKASTSTQNKNTPHLPATPLLIGQSRPGLGTPGEGRSARRRQREPTPPPPGAVPDGESASSRSVGRPCASPPGRGEAGKCPSVRACRGTLGRMRVRACSRTSVESKAGTDHHRNPLRRSEDSPARTDPSGT